MNKKILPHKEVARSSEEEGFTLIELMIVIVIIGILAAVAFLIFGNQQRAAIDGTVKQDVTSNKAVIAPGKQGKLYKNTVDFLDISNSTDKNERGYTVNARGDEACTWSWRKYSETDTTLYNFRTSTGKIGEGGCPNLGTGSTVVTSDGSNSITAGQPSTNPPAASGTPIDPPITSVTEIPSLTPGSGEYSCSYEPYDFHKLYSKGQGMASSELTVKKTSGNPSNWECILDYSKAPFFGKVPSSGDTEVIVTNIGSNKVKFSNKDEGSSLSEDSTVGGFAFSASGITYPEAEGEYDFSITRVNTNCVRVNVTTDSTVPVSWHGSINLDEWFTGNLATLTYPTNINRTLVTGNTYTLNGTGFLYALNNERQITASDGVVANFCKYS